MTKEKQIEEMAEIMVSKPSCMALPCSKCDFHNMTNCMSRFVANYLYEEGYRKASEVAREVIDDVGAVFDEMIDEASSQLASARLECDLKAVKMMEYGIDVLRLAYRTLQKSLKKKYKGDGE